MNGVRSTASAAGQRSLETDERRRGGRRDAMNHAGPAGLREFSMSCPAASAGGYVIPPLRGSEDAAVATRDLSLPKPQSAFVEARRGAANSLGLLTGATSVFLLRA